MLSNVELLDKRLSYILTDPFKQIVEAKKKAQTEPETKIWQGRQGSNLRPQVLETCATTS